MKTREWREDPLLIGAVVTQLMGGPDENDFIYYGDFANAMEVYGQDSYSAHFIMEDVVDAYDDADWRSGM